MQDCISCDHMVSQISQLFNCYMLREVAFSERKGAILHCQSSANQPAFWKHSLCSMTIRKKIKIIRFQRIQNHNKQFTLKTYQSDKIKLISLNQILKFRPHTREHYGMICVCIFHIFIAESKAPQSTDFGKGEKEEVEKGKDNQMSWLSEQSMKPGQSMKTNPWFVFTFLSS